MKLILGTAQFSDNYGLFKNNTINETVANKILNTAYDLGINTLDTAELYGNSHSIIGLNKNKFKIHTKINNLENLDFKFKEINKNLRHQIIEVLYVHDSKLAFEPSTKFDPLLEFRNEKYLNFGISIYTEDEFKKSLDLGIFQYIQIPFNVLDRRFNKNILEIAAKNKVKIIARSALLQGILAEGSLNLPKKLDGLSYPIKKLEKISFDNNLSLKELAIKWIFSQKNIDGVVIGVNNAEQLIEIKNIVDSPSLTSYILDEIDDTKIENNILFDPRFW